MLTVKLSLESTPRKNGSQINVDDGSGKSTPRKTGSHCKHPLRSGGIDPKHHDGAVPIDHNRGFTTICSAYRGDSVASRIAVAHCLKEPLDCGFEGSQARLGLRSQ
ncbi:hypothetical protein GCM10007382_00080 [Salinibacterium xinjiangense]|nr:hypothetical protein GCM10007382_00080 [Salinibacterium xinjiangense]